MKFKLSLVEIRNFCMICLPLSRATRNSMSEFEIIEYAYKSNWLTREETSSVRSRSDTRYANKIHNVVSHRDSRRNPIRLGLIEWDQITASFSLTQKGCKFLDGVASKLKAVDSSQFDAISAWLRTFDN